jgi:hypothetical protein
MRTHKVIANRQRDNFGHIGFEEGRRAQAPGVI